MTQRVQKRVNDSDPEGGMVGIADHLNPSGRKCFLLQKQISNVSTLAAVKLATSACGKMQ